MLSLLDRALCHAVSATSLLVLPVSVLLFLQWPLREWLQAYSREANDLAQVVFAVYVSVAITAATRFGTKDARFLYHAGAIRIASEGGKSASGRALIEEALKLNPHFDAVSVTEAEKALGRFPPRPLK